MVWLFSDAEYRLDMIDQRRKNLPTITLFFIPRDLSERTPELLVGVQAFLHEGCMRRREVRN